MPCPVYDCYFTKKISSLLSRPNRLPQGPKCGHLWYQLQAEEIFYSSIVYLLCLCAGKLVRQKKTQWVLEVENPTGFLLSSNFFYFWVLVNITIFIVAKVESLNSLRLLRFRSRREGFKTGTWCQENQHFGVFSNVRGTKSYGVKTFSAYCNTVKLKTCSAKLLLQVDKGLIAYSNPPNELLYIQRAWHSLHKGDRN